MPKSKKENIEEMTLDPIEEKVKEPAPVEEPIEEPIEPETVEEGKDITEPDEFIEPEESEQGEDVEFDEETGEEETDEDAPEEDAPPFLGLMLGAKNAPVSEDPDPQSRIEALLWHIINGTTTDAEPQSRNEAILTAIANSGTYTEEAQSRIEALLISILNHEEVDITPISRNEAILKAIANTGEYNEEPQSRNEELLIKWLEAISIVIGTASGAVASFNTSLTENLLSAVAEFSASQASGTPTPSTPIPIVGVDKVNVSRCGKNLIEGIDNNILGLSNNIITYASGKGTIIKARLVAGQSYIISGVTKNRGIVAYFDEMPQLNATTSKYQSFGNTSYTFTADYSGFALIYIANSVIDTTSAQLEFGSTATAYEAYNGATKTLNLGGDYYGGSVDAVTGKITLTHIYIFSDGADDTNWSYYSAYGSSYNFRYAYSGLKASGDISCNLLPKGNVGTDREIVSIATNGNYINFEISSSRLNGNTVADLMTFFASNNVQIVVELATPLVVYASNTAEIPTIVGFNQVYADTGDVAVEYKKRRND